MAARTLLRRSLLNCIPLQTGQRTCQVSSRTLGTFPIVYSSKWKRISRFCVQSPVAQYVPECVHMSSNSRQSQTSMDSSKGGGKSYEPGSILAQFDEKDGEPKQLSTAKKVVEAGKDAGYMGIILAGLGFTGFLLWAVMSEFFSSNSPQKLFAKALRVIKNNEQARNVLGHPIAGYGDTTGRGRRRHISSQEYIVNGEEYMRVVFFVAGSKRKGTAEMDLKKNESGKYICRYLIVTLDGSSAVITIEDNR